MVFKRQGAAPRDPLSFEAEFLSRSASSGMPDLHAQFFGALVARPHVDAGQLSSLTCLSPMPTQPRIPRKEGDEFPGSLRSTPPDSNCSRYRHSQYACCVIIDKQDFTNEESRSPCESFSAVSGSVRHICLTRSKVFVAGFRPVLKFVSARAR